MAEQMGLEPTNSALRTRLSRQNVKRLPVRKVAAIEGIHLTMRLSATRDPAISLALNHNGMSNGVKLRSEISVGILLTKVQDQVTSASKPLKSPPSWPQLGSCSWIELLTALSKLFLRIGLWCWWRFKWATSVPDTYSVAVYFELRSVVVTSWGSWTSGHCWHNWTQQFDHQ